MEVYFNDLSHLKEPNSVPPRGIVHPLMGNKIFLNERIFLEKDSSLLEPVYIHELEHVKQNESMGCASIRPEANWLQETAAEYSKYINSSSHTDLFRSRYSVSATEDQGVPHVDDELFIRLNRDWSYTVPDRPKKRLSTAYYSAYLWEYLNEMSGGQNHYQQVFKDIGRGDFDLDSGTYTGFFDYLKFLNVDIESYLEAMSQGFRYPSAGSFFGELENYYGEQKRDPVIDKNGEYDSGLEPYSQGTVWVKRKDSQSQILKVSIEPEVTYKTSPFKSPNAVGSPSCNIQYQDTQEGVIYFLIRPKFSIVEGFDVRCEEDLYLSLHNPTEDGARHKLELMDDPFHVQYSNYPTLDESYVGDALITKGLSNTSECPAPPEYNFTENSSNFYWHFLVEAEVPTDVNGEKFTVWERSTDGNYLRLPSGTGIVSNDFIEWTYVSAPPYDEPITFFGSLAGYKFEDVFGRDYYIQYEVEYDYPPSSCQ